MKKKIAKAPRGLITNADRARDAVAGRKLTMKERASSSMPNASTTPSPEEEWTPEDFDQSSIIAHLESEIERLELRLQIAKQRGFCLLEDEPMCWEYTLPKPLLDAGGFMTKSVHIYSHTREEAKAQLEGSGFSGVKIDDLWPARPIETSKPRERDA